jgi:hypothetical protein
MRGPCQKLTCTFVSVAIHKLQRVQSDSTERTREFPTGQETARNVHVSFRRAGRQITRARYLGPPLDYSGGA